MYFTLNENSVTKDFENKKITNSLQAYTDNTNIIVR